MPREISSILPEVKQVGDKKVIAGRTNNPEYDKLPSAPSAPSANESPSEPEKPEECPNCGDMVDPYNKNTHPSCCSGSGRI
jgi:hypothetical protein